MYREKVRPRSGRETGMGHAVARQHHGYWYNMRASGNPSKPGPGVSDPGCGLARSTGIHAILAVLQCL